MLSTQTPFYTRQGHTVFPAESANIRKRRGVFALARAADAVLLIEQKHSNSIWELPGGGIEDGETHDQALEREWAEETGLPFDLKGPFHDYQHTRGFYAEDLDEFWIYDQTFRLYDYTGTAEVNRVWVNPENDQACWKAVSDFAKLRINQAHMLGIAALMQGI